MKTVQERVRDGIELLDRVGPDDWRDRINLDTLDLNHMCLCPLGQLYGEYGEGRNILFGLSSRDTDMPAEYGFDIDPLDSPPPEGDSFDALQREWERQLRGEDESRTVTAYVLMEITAPDFALPFRDFHGSVGGSTRTYSRRDVAEKAAKRYGENVRVGEVKIKL